MSKFDYLVYILRAEPFTEAHRVTIEKALTLSDKVITLVGSSFAPRDLRNPFTYEERALMIRGSFKDEKRLFIEPIRDYPYNDDKWTAQVRRIVMKIVFDNLDTIAENKPHVTLHGALDARIGIIGFEKDDTSFYLNIFPEWKPEYITEYKLPSGVRLDATNIRNDYFSAQTSWDVLRINFQLNVPKPTMDFLLKFYETEEYKTLLKEAEFQRKHNEMWSNVPYPVIFQTADSVVTQSGHILLVTRKHFPGKGLLALPGGYVKADEPVLKSALRELREETKLKVPVPVLIGSLKGNRRFDHPKRSTRGRIITEAFYFPLKDIPDGLPKVKGSDDAEKADWYPLASLRSENLFEDHLHIIDYFTGAIS